MKPRMNRPRKISNSYKRPQLQRRSQTRNVAIFVTCLVVFSLLLSFSSSGKKALRKATIKPDHENLAPKQEASWKDDDAWHTDPLSWAISSDQKPMLLPPDARPYIYTYYDAGTDTAVRQAEQALIRIWRRAWWAQGFTPVILSKADAQRHSLYASLQPSSGLYDDALRWLAWASAGNGTLTNWLCLPMSLPDDHEMILFRRIAPSGLQVYEGFGSALLRGDSRSVSDIVEKALRSPTVDTARFIKDAIDASMLKGPTAAPKSLVLYDADTNADNYKSLATKMINDQAAGLVDLASLISSHLHQSFLEPFSDGFAVLSPFDQQTHAVTAYARAVADALRTCPDSPIPKSCPPNIPKCRICPPGSKQAILHPPHFANSSTIFTLGTISHPLSLAVLLTKSPELSMRRIRRHSLRDQWLHTVTRESMGTAIGALARIQAFKDTVASKLDGFSRSMWVTSEELPCLEDIEHYFGFALPNLNVSQDVRTMLDFDLQADQTLDVNEKEQDDAVQRRQHSKQANEMRLQADLFEYAAEMATRTVTGPDSLRIREVIEKWNLADTEVWSFVRAFSARTRVRRKKWEEQAVRSTGHKGNLKAP